MSTRSRSEMLFAWRHSVSHCLGRVGVGGVEHMTWGIYSFLRLGAWRRTLHVLFRGLSFKPPTKCPRAEIQRRDIYLAYHH